MAYQCYSSLSFASTLLTLSLQHWRTDEKTTYHPLEQLCNNPIIPRFRHANYDSSIKIKRHTTFLAFAAVCPFPCTFLSPISVFPIILAARMQQLSKVDYPVGCWYICMRQSRQSSLFRGLNASEKLSSSSFQPSLTPFLLRLLFVYNKQNNQDSTPVVKRTILHHVGFMDSLYTVELH